MPSATAVVQPLYTTEDAEATFPLFRPVAMHTPTQIGPGVVYQSFEAGHIFGSTTMLLELESGGQKVRLGFTGDLGRPGLAHHSRSRAAAAGRLPDHGKHLWQPGS